MASVTSTSHSIRMVLFILFGNLHSRHGCCEVEVSNDAMSSKVVVLRKFAKATFSIVVFGDGLSLVTKLTEATS